MKPADAFQRTDSRAMFPLAYFSATVDHGLLIWSLCHGAGGGGKSKDFPDYRLLRGKRRLYLIDHRVPYGVFDPAGPVDTNRVTFAPQFPNLEIVLASAKQMQQIANARGGFPYLALGGIDISGDSAMVELAIEHAQSEESKGKVLLLSGGGYRLAFVKEEGEWVYLPGRGSYWMY